MLKNLGILIGGVFIGAVGSEIIYRKCPDAASRIYAKGCEMTSEIKEAFKKGYKNAALAKDAAEPST